MQFRLMLALAAVVSIATAGSATKADEFAVLDAVSATPLSAQEMAAVEGRIFVSFVSSFRIVQMSDLVLSTSEVGDTSNTSTVGVRFLHGGCAKGTGRICGAGKLDGWAGDPLPRGF